ncbi:hypothetical protein RSOLAG1IB_04922 [Rhizoctonia solani AG-1 IB]|uniref:Uncharacterized protein n=1 Tax=Thanatephorus cucumeris (strain AG1-IB / isolate 7/3/14) TaxID=1108050 RepID=A0A0B7FXD4_THACB|nr:hypothetical protein RSOLAG1IB_04922 [Rhizoctonia solani AG-1 IB]
MAHMFTFSSLTSGILKHTEDHKTVPPPPCHSSPPPSHSSLDLDGLVPPPPSESEGLSYTASTTKGTGSNFFMCEIIV